MRRRGRACRDPPLAGGYPASAADSRSRRRPRSAPALIEASGAAGREAVGRLGAHPVSPRAPLATPDRSALARPRCRARDALRCPGEWRHARPLNFIAAALLLRRHAAPLHRRRPSRDRRYRGGARRRTPTMRCRSTPCSSRSRRRAHGAGPGGGARPARLAARPAGHQADRRGATTCDDARAVERAVAGTALRGDRRAGSRAPSRRRCRSRWRSRAANSSPSTTPRTGPIPMQLREAHAAFSRAGPNSPACKRRSSSTTAGPA